jgi:hypothetical protein
MALARDWRLASLVTRARRQDWLGTEPATFLRSTFSSPGSPLHSTMAFGILPLLTAYQGQQFCVLAFTEDILDPASREFFRENREFRRNNREFDWV